MRFTIEVLDLNPFNAGWVAYVLDLPRPSEEWAALGWDTGAETPSLSGVRYVFATQPTLAQPQYVVGAPPAVAP